MIGDPFTDIVIYRSPDYVQPSVAAPLYIHDWAELREQCRLALSRRRETYPAWIEAGRISAEAAQADIHAWELLHAQWIWIIDGPDAEGAQLPDLISLVARADAVALALSRIDQEIARGNRTHEVLLQSHLNQALRWHLECEQRGIWTAADAADLNRQIRADRAGQVRWAA